jgi:hypothetical protein
MNQVFPIPIDPIGGGRRSQNLSMISSGPWTRPGGAEETVPK